MVKLQLSLLQKNFLKAFMTKLLIVPAFWFFFKAVYPIYRYPLIDPIIYIMLSLFDWLSLTLILLATAALDLILNTMGIRNFLATFKMRNPLHVRRTSEPERKKEKSLPI